MILTTHAVVGATTYGLLQDNPVLASAAAFSSHYVLDYFPHWEYETDPRKTKDKKIIIVLKILIDLAIAFTLVSILAFYVFPTSPKNFAMVLTGAFFGLLPDGFQLLYMLRFRHKTISWTQRVHDFFHSEDESLKRSVRAMVTQVVIVLVCIAIIYMI
ncbi:MAG: hypothetical protein WCF94_03760 [bacterium]